MDMVDDESRPERRPAKHMQTPREWNLKHNPAYSYYAYYVYANLYTLNKLREARRHNTFRPHAGVPSCSSEQGLGVAVRTQAAPLVARRYMNFVCCNAKDVDCLVDDHVSLTAVGAH